MIRNFNVDWDSVEGISRLIRQLSARKREVRNKGCREISSKVGNGKRLEACFRILYHDISSLYSDLTLDTSSKYYVYAHLDTSKPLDAKSVVEAFAATLRMDYKPFYIGKGTGERDAEIFRNETHRKIVQRLRTIGKEPKIIKLDIGLTESKALQLEAKLIDIFRLIPNGGYLSNLDEGHNRLLRRKMYRNELLMLHGKEDYEKLRLELFEDSAPYIKHNAISTDAGGSTPPSPPILRIPRNANWDDLDSTEVM